MNINNKIKNPYKAFTTEDLKNRKDKILDSFLAPENAIRSSLITRSIKCGKPNCHCVDGEGHKSLYLSSYYRGFTYLDYVPKSYEEKLTRCIHDFDKMSELLIELSEINLELFRRRELEL